jgi:hypothetical protein
MMLTVYSPGAAEVCGVKNGDAADASLRVLGTFGDDITGRKFHIVCVVFVSIGDMLACLGDKPLRRGFDAAISRRVGASYTMQIGVTP